MTDNSPSRATGSRGAEVDSVVVVEESGKTTSVALEVVEVAGGAVVVEVAGGAVVVEVAGGAVVVEVAGGAVAVV
ncbi:MAG: hypothetical protein OEM81_12380, partial [Acidimicrobiia bacterium]|nr:hypothetical protein [Acidimicrobiia bacterium]